MKYVKKLVRYYKALALMLLNVGILLVFFNIALWGAFKVKDSLSSSKAADPASKRYANPNLKKVYPQLTEQTIKDLLHETWSRTLTYEPFTQFKEGPYKGNYVNVDPHGFRITENPGSWPPDPNSLNVFMFGGSTLFGYGVPDDQTIASHLQRFLTTKLSRRVRVYNFGRGFYYSTQERILFENLLRSGDAPDMAIFVDGLNDFYFKEDIPEFTSRLAKSMKAKDRTTKDRVIELIGESDLPMFRLARGLRDRAERIARERSGAGSGSEPETDSCAGDEDADNNEPAVISVVNRYMQNKKLIEAVAAAHDVKSVFVWQPVSTYKHNLKYDLFGEPSASHHYFSRHGYKYMAEHIDELFLGDNFLWLAGIQQDRQQPLYVDPVHYSGDMSDIISRTIGDLLLERNLLIQDTH